MRRDVCMRLRYLACDTIHLLGAISADCVTVREGTVRGVVGEPWRAKARAEGAPSGWRMLSGVEM